MKVYVDPLPKSLSIAMYRVALALRKTAPDNVEIVSRPELADVQVLHAIGPDALNVLQAPHYAVLQYCVWTGAADPRVFWPLWQNALLVWSYYKLEGVLQPHVPFYHSPLGVDGSVFSDRPWVPRDIGCMSSGYVSGPAAEAIDEVAQAASRMGMSVVHLGPAHIEGMQFYPPTWSNIMRVSDLELATYYRRAKWVSGLRHAEGFELPVIEGLACGARPIVFDRPDMREWYAPYAVFVPESNGEELIRHLMHVFSHEPGFVTQPDRDKLLHTFNWVTTAQGFWSRVCEVVNA